MIPALLNRYRLDLTGSSSQNKVVGEPHQKEADAMFFAFVPNAGCFYKSSLKVYTGTTQLATSKYTVHCPNSAASQSSGLEVDAIIEIKDTTITSVSIDYQAVGGEYAWTTYALNDLLETAARTNQNIDFNAILNKPVDYPPSPHLHNLNAEMYGTDWIVMALNNILNAIRNGNIVLEEDITLKMRSLLARVTTTIEAQESRNQNNTSTVATLSSTVRNLTTTLTATASTTNALERRLNKSRLFFSGVC